ncbi:MAG: YihY family inner membrane protein [Chlorobium sp.]|jgi:membrane protein|nr:YihY family inner membrane protein [Chlorobium sp.]
MFEGIGGETLWRKEKQRPVKELIDFHMDWLHKKNEHDEWLSDRDGELYIRVFFPFFWKNFIHDKIFLSAGSLAFQSLLSLVPLLSVTLSILRVFPVFESLNRYLEDYVLQNFIPGTGTMLREYLNAFIDKTSSVPLLGVVFLFIIALSLISTIDHTLNEIWEVYAPRKIVQGFTLYWTVLTLGPVLIGSSLVASSFVWYTVFTEGPLLELKTRLLSFLPFLNSVIAFFLLYMLVPNRRVRFYHAVYGSLLAAVLFELSKKWFVFYVSHFATFEYIYGALSVIPMLFFWIYLEWVVVLTGAEFVFCLGSLKPKKSISEPFDPMRGIDEILVVLGWIWEGQKTGTPLSMKSIMKKKRALQPSRARSIVDLLLQAGIVHGTANAEFAVSSDLYETTLFDLYTKIPGGFGANESETRGNGGAILPESIGHNVTAGIKSAMTIPLATVLQDKIY